MLAKNISRNPNQLEGTAQIEQDRTADKIQKNVSHFLMSQIEQRMKKSSHLS